MKRSMVIIACLFTCLLEQDAFAAIQFKRFQHCRTA